MTDSTPAAVFCTALDRHDVVMLRAALQKDRTLANQVLQQPAYQFPIVYAVTKQQASLELVQELLDHQADVNARVGGNRTALYYAVEYDNLELAKLLLDHGAEVDAKVYGTPALHCAPSGQMARLLITRGADVNSRDLGGKSPVIGAVSKGNLERVMLLVEHGADTHVTDFRKGLACIHEAAFGSYLEILQYLIHQGSDVNPRATDGRTPLFFCRDLEVARLLLQHGADVNARTPLGETPLNSCHDLHLARLFLERGADVNAQDLDGNTALGYAGNMEMAKLLVEYGADITMGGEKSLDFATERNKLEMVRYLLGLGIRIPLHAVFDMSEMQFSARESAGPIIMLHIEHGADIHARESRYGVTVLHRACQSDNIAMVELVLQKGADIRARDNEGRTPLILACVLHNWEAVKKLVDHGSIVNDRAFGWAMTPLSVACEQRNLEMVQYLLNAGASVHYRDSDGSFPLWHAAMNIDSECAALLLERGADIHAQVPSTSASTPCSWSERGADGHAQMPRPEDATPFFLSCGCMAGLDITYTMIRFSAHHRRPQLKF